MLDGKTIVNLAEQHGKEGAITRGYCEYVEKLNSKDAQQSHKLLSMDEHSLVFVGTQSMTSIRRQKG